jgi:hypothetical protein
MYLFAEHPSKNFFDRNLNPAALRNNATSVLAIFDRRGERLAYLSVAPGQHRPRDLDLLGEHAGLRDHILASSGAAPQCGLLRGAESSSCCAGHR